MFPGTARHRENCRIYPIANAGTRISLKGDDPDFIVLEAVNISINGATVTLPNTAPIGKTFTLILTANPQTIPAITTQGIVISIPAIRKGGVSLSWALYAGQDARFIYTPNGWLTPRGALTGADGVATSFCVAIGESANAANGGIAFGPSASAYNSGVAVGFSALAPTTAVAVGYNSTGSTNGVAIGYFANTNSKDSAIALGRNSKAERYRELVKGADNATTTLQSFSILDWYGDTTDATATEILLGGTAAQYAVLLNNSAFNFKLLAVARNNVLNDCAFWELTGGIKRGANAAATAIVGTVTKTVIAKDTFAAAWDIDATADTTNGSLKITVTGAATTTIRWNVRGDISELRF